MKTASLHVHLLQSYASEFVADLRGQLDPGIQVSLRDDADGLASCHVLVAGRPQREQLEAAKRLHTLIIPWAGLPPETRDLLAEFPFISAHNLHHNAGAVAEHAVALLLAAAKCVIPFDQALRQGDWTLRYAEPRDAVLLSEKTVLILGYGAIGRRIARICRAMDMAVLATRRTPPYEGDGIAGEIYPPHALPALLPRANCLIIALPLTPQTRELIGANELDLLPPGAILVNIGRGPIVREEALYQALVNGGLGAAGLDVWYNYPRNEEERVATMPTSYPFHELQNVVFSPHHAGLTADTEPLRAAHLAGLLNAAIAGQPVPNKIDLSKGY